MIPMIIAHHLHKTRKKHEKARFPRPLPTEPSQALQALNLGPGDGRVRYYSISIVPHYLRVVNNVC
ncbi:hypothetical protein SAMN05421790_11327 [Kroppenstedtia eburnea]|uniref:Uncharacterized protein n=1 Tax=Kroppenstedtia eburnea TaxID=714067 RepID=A0A1N7PL27_9BACL|nr:hypothetical protein SAMN05421790_11327 [Kroppenstedtia eburnea]